MQEQTTSDAVSPSGDDGHVGGLFFAGTGDAFYKVASRDLLKPSETEPDAGDDGYNSEDEEWATLYGTSGSVGILDKGNGGSSSTLAASSGEVEYREVEYRRVFTLSYFCFCFIRMPLLCDADSRREKEGVSVP